MLFNLLEKITLVASRAVKPKDTEYFPERDKSIREKPKRFRGRHFINAETCIGCYACERACPIGAIVMVPTGLKRPRAMPVVNLGRCCYCGLCEDSCPTKEKSIYLTEDYEIMVTDIGIELSPLLDELWAKPVGDITKNPLVIKDLKKMQEKKENQSGGSKK
jgi:formate hydrogenlyase subunit 6/NADH:ubiquinone oxidoreductase subunit I